VIPLYKVHMPDTIMESLKDVLFCGYLADGEYSRRFEDALRAYLGNANVTTHDNVSTALMLALYAAGVRPDDEVIASPVACLATNQPILNLFARVVWADVDPLTGMLDPAHLASRITERAKAIVYPHWAGDVADIDGIGAVARTHGLKVIEDAGEALGAEYRGRKVGATGSDFTVFAFHAIRHITTGEGAAITYADPDVAQQARSLKRYGIHQPTFRDEWDEISPTSDVPLAGYNSYLTNIAGAIGLEQMKSLASNVARHRSNGEYYERALAGVPGITVLRRLPHARSAFWVYTLLAERRDDLLRALRGRGVYASKVHLRNDVYSCFGKPTDPLPGVDEFAARYLCIPCGWWVSEEDRASVVAAIRQGW
jgi:dTDP-4-amino-4,6-dideoxygalactose transaminase